MATITRRGRGWYVQVRRKGFPARYRTFQTKLESTSWAREQEHQLDSSSSPPVAQSANRTTLGEFVMRYREAVTPRKRSAGSETFRLGKMVNASVCQLRVNELSPAHFAQYRDGRLLIAKPSTVRRELCLFRVVLEVARKEWGVSIGR